jgi:Uma2 family endonuclease
MSEQRTLLTAEEFFRLYSHRDGDYELVKGEVVKMAPPGGVHGGTATNIASALHTFVRQHDLGRVVVESGFRLESQPDTVRGPDVAFVSKERLPAEGLPRAFFTIAPDLAVEVVSPSDTASDMEQKVQDYLRNGAQRVWVVYPDTRTIVVYRPDGTARVFSGDATIEDPELLPGFSLSLQEIFSA